MTRRLTIALTLFLLASGTALAVSPQSWTVDSAEEFLEGEGTGFSVSARGEISPGPRIVKVTDVSDPFVLSQATDGKGSFFIGTGNSGNLYRLRGSKLELIHQVPEPQIYALAYVKGTLVVGSSPNGKLYSIDPTSGASKELFDPGEAYIWCIEPLPDGSLLVGTGLEGRVYKVGLDGQGSVFFDSPDMHIRALDAAGGRILAGSAGSSARIYELTSAGVGRALHESSFSEITAIEIDESKGVAWAAAVTTVLPSTAPARSTQSTQAGQGSQTSGQKETAEDDAAMASVDVSFSFGPGQTPAQAARVGASEVYRIERDGFVTSVRRLEREVIYALRANGKGGVHVGTGPAGRIYTLDGGEMSLIGSVPEKQIVTLDGAKRVMVTTTNKGAVYELDVTRPESVEIRSKAGDTARFSTFGAYSIEGRGVAGNKISIRFRSGNTSTPDATWSDWQEALKAPDGPINAPAARYLQWKIEIENPSDGLAIESVRCAYVNRNVPPQIDNVTLHDPGVVFVASAYPSSPQVLEATNPDEYGIFNSLDNPGARNDPGKRLFRKGYRTITWRVSDENGDDLRYTVQFRPEGARNWLRLRENLRDTSLNFDTSQLPDGRYEIRLVASDEVSNPGNGLEAARKDLVVTVDNSGPVISNRPSGEIVEVIVSDSLSPIVKAEYSVDAEKWIPMVPVDGLADSKEERYRLTKKEIAGRVVIFRAVDAQFNVATAAVPTK
jgi:outer membrane protein assembly factor BamB